MGHGISVRGLERSIHQVEGLLGPLADEGLNNWGNTSRGRHDVCDKERDEVKEKKGRRGFSPAEYKVSPFVELRRSVVEKAERGFLPRPNCA